MSDGKIIDELLILAVYIFIGYFVKRIKMIHEAGVHDISKIVVNVAMPLTVISSMNLEYKAELINNMLYLAVFSFAYLSIAALASTSLSSLFPMGDDKKRALRYSMIFGNSIFLGYPLCNALFGQIGMFYASIFVAAQNIFQWTLGVHIYKGKNLSVSSLKRLVNPGLVAIFIGLSMFFLGIRTPEMISRVIDGVGAISTPLALMVIGATLEEYRMSEIIQDRGTQFVAFVKTIAFPGIFLALLYFIPIHKSLKAILTIEAAAPVQASGTVFAKNFGGDSGTVAKCVALSTTVCAFSMPIFLWFISH